VVVQNPEAAPYSIAGSYNVLVSHAGAAASIQAQVETVLAGHLAWQKSKMGRAVNPSALAGKIQAIPGIQRVELTQPAYQGLDPWQVAVETDAQLIYGGLADG
jgi:phage-related baseplate assembly protein